MRRLAASELRAEQERTLSAPRLRYGVLSRLLFALMDLSYGRRTTLSKSKVLELVARMPYQAWEHVAFIAVTHTHRNFRLARRVFDRIREERVQHDNETWHLFLLEELVQGAGIREGFVRYWLIPQILAFVYYHICWLLYVVAPRAAYQLNAEFEDHAEHEYMQFVRDHPELEGAAWETEVCAEYGSFASVADVFRQMGYDERVHKLESLAWLSQPRFA